MMDKEEIRFKPLTDFQQLLFREQENGVLRRVIAKKNGEIDVLKKNIIELVADLRERGDEETVAELRHKIKNITIQMQGESKNKRKFKKLYNETLKELNLFRKF